jgi:putative transposase
VHRGGLLVAGATRYPVPGSGNRVARQAVEDPLRQRPEYVSDALRDWAVRRGVVLQFIQPGKPQQNAYIERYNKTVRYDWLAHYLFETVADVQEYATKWLWSYNHERPNTAIGGVPPKQKLPIAA